jgi:hypothetical protein
MVDPITLGLLGTAAGAGVAQTIGGLIPSKFDKKNKAEIERLEAMKEGGRMGMTPAERQLMQQQQLNPVRSAAEAMQQRQEAFAAATGQASGAQVGEARRETQAAVGDAVQRAAQNIQQENIERRRAQEAELAQRQAVQEERRSAKVSGALGGIGQAAGAGAALAAAVPEVYNAQGAFGRRMQYQDLNAALEGLDPDTMAYMQSVGPRGSRQLLNAALSGSMDKHAVALREHLRRTAVEQGVTRFVSQQDPSAIGGDFALAGGDPYFGGFDQGWGQGPHADYSLEYGSGWKR